MSFKGKKKISKKTGAIITMSSLSAVAIILGAVLGVYLHGLTAPKEEHKVVVTGGDENLLNTYGQVLEQDSDVDFTSLVKKNVFTYSDVANISMMLLKKHTNYMTQGKGTAKGGPVVQQIRDTVIRNDSTYMEESISNSSAVSLASRAFQTADGVKLYNGAPVDGNVEVGSYGTTPTDYTLDDYFANFGRTVDTPLIYIIDDTTVNPSTTTASGDPATSFTKTEAGYTLELELSPTGSTTNYAVQMITLSKLSSLTFTYVHLTFYLDAKLQLIATQSHEYYTVTLKAIPLPTGTEGHLRTEYFVDGGYAIPELQTPIAYRSGD